MNIVKNRLVFLRCNFQFDAMKLFLSRRCVLCFCVAVVTRHIIYCPHTSVRNNRQWAAFAVHIRETISWADEFTFGNRQPNI